MPLRQLYPDPENTAEDEAIIEYALRVYIRLSISNPPQHRRTGPDGNLWLRDELPKELPHARIFLYEYNSTAVYGKDRTTFLDKVNGFLEELRIDRRKAPRRPLLLLGHSLGGLLIKQALINAHNNEKYEDIKDATQGLAFFATPHDGGKQSLVNIGKIAAKIALELGFQKGDNILETLKLSPGRASHGGVCKFGTNQQDRDNFKLVQANIQDLYDSAIRNGELVAVPKEDPVDGALEKRFTGLKEN
ncbi:hypothetical protein CEP54_005682 [Fusarium duplospermum]|uniref:DUF676 domain-containing protein n=1 Tax=Fusarium duplospermum TaxID=1325734 RepID=A0A428QB77_9HYPO|nr:hypothetical protein CEP54_005682 [Fusarium duplospermum]